MLCVFIFGIVRVFYFWGFCCFFFVVVIRLGVFKGVILVGLFFWYLEDLNI